MEQMLFKIKEGLQEFLPDVRKFELIPDTPLKLIPDWDSMCTVNLKIYLEDAFGVDVPEDLLEGESTLGEIIDFIGKAN
jgi:acyl carrier protein